MLRWGPQPAEGVLSVLLQEFPAYTVSELLREDWLILERILDYRRARLAIDLFNGGQRGRAELAERDDLMALLLDMGRAQNGDGYTVADVMAGLEQARPEKDEDDDDGR